MKITLITPTPPDISAFGVRSLSAYLREQGHAVKLIFLPGGIDRLNVEGEYSYRYPQQIINDILDICHDSELIGLSFMTQYFDRARQITQAIKERYQCPVVWGGFHPTLCPTESLAFADYVIEGEGEIPLLNLIQYLQGTKAWLQVPNVWRLLDEKPQSSGHYYWLNDITVLPTFDFSLKNHYVIDIATRRVTALTEDLFYQILPKMPYFEGKYITVYRTMTSRGCPHQCSYCINRTLRQRFCQGTYLRRRDVQQVIEELSTTKKRYPGIEGIHFFDDSFFSNTLHYLESFCEIYQNDIKLPFYCQGSPEAITSRKLDLLLEAGLVFCEMGIQTGSGEIARLYRRTATNSQIKSAITTIDHYRHRLLKPHYHVIVDNPWETLPDKIETVKLLLEIPHPFMLCLASLTLFPGTELHEKALEENIIKDPIKDVYRKAFYKPQPTYLNFIITLTDHYYLPKPLLKVMIKPAIINLFQRHKLAGIWKFFLFFDQVLIMLGKGFQAIRFGNLWRIRQFLHKIQ
ncbi:B12-binding domain-containing radical SAM protein [candidate division CSSED10-310 bacterium]|uniref:B12-binding domain-containing radical SAM protein n=1 Tax=candidate division CSSED10-310 bacterium TaxID=2855610 RepID=A0ABV6YRH8_UNCC1